MFLRDEQLLVQSKYGFLNARLKQFVQLSKQLDYGGMSPSCCFFVMWYDQSDPLSPRLFNMLPLVQFHDVGASKLTLGKARSLS